MTASSVTGKGHGASNKLTTKELAILANGPSILITGTAEAESSLTSPPSVGNDVIFQNPLPGPSTNYVILLTTQNGGYAYTTQLHQNSNNDFSGFSFFSEAECTLMYLVANIGCKPTTTT